MTWEPSSWEERRSPSQAHLDELHNYSTSQELQLGTGISNDTWHGIQGPDAGSIRLDPLSGRRTYTDLGFKTKAKEQAGTYAKG